MKAAILLLILLAPNVAAVAGTYASLQPADTEDQWRVGTSVRICATETPDGTATLTLPDATTTALTADAENCWAFTLTQSGLHDVYWEVAAAPRNIQFEAWGPSETDWTWWLNFLFLAGVVIAGAGMGWILVTMFGFIGLVAFALEGILPFNFQETLSLILLAFVLQYVADNWRAKRR